MLSVQFENSLRMIVGSLRPFGGFMTCGAICSQLALMPIILLMAGEAIFGRAFEHIVDMAFFAGYRQVGISQFEGGKIMVEVNRLPIIRCVARSAVWVHGAFMRIIVCVTG